MNPQISHDEARKMATEMNPEEIIALVEKLKAAIREVESVEIEICKEFIILANEILARRKMAKK